MVSCPKQLVDQMVKGMGNWVRDKLRVRAWARECNNSFFSLSLVLQNVVNTFDFVGSVASYEYLIR